jgi:hypothetical protein
MSKMLRRSSIDKAATSSYEPLPFTDDYFTGAQYLMMPSYLPGQGSGVILPSRLKELGNQV